MSYLCKGIMRSWKPVVFLIVLLLLVVSPTVQFQMKGKLQAIHGKETENGAFRSRKASVDSGFRIPTPNPTMAVWNCTYGGSAEDQVRSAIECRDGGFALLGFTYSYGAGASDFWFVRTDEYGNQLWVKTYGGTDFDFGVEVVECQDGGFALAGYTQSFGLSDYDYWLIKTDSDGTHLWNKTYDGFLADFCYAMVECADGGFALAGPTYTESPFVGYDFWIVRTNAAGSPLWNHTYGGTDDEVCRDLLECSNGDFALAGDTESYGAGNDDFWLVRVDASGNHLWNQTYGGVDQDYSWRLVECSTGGFALTGKTRSFGSGPSDRWMVRTDALGNHIWNQTYGGSGEDAGGAFVESSVGGFLLGSETESYGAGLRDVWLVRTDSIGNSLWDETYGGSNQDICFEVIECHMGGYAFAGHTRNWGAGNFDFWLVRVQPVEWVEEPTDQFILLDQSFSYDLNVTAHHGLDMWWLNDTTNFAIDGNGVLANTTTLSLGKYGVQIRVNDSVGDFILGEFEVNVLDYIPLDPPLLTAPLDGYTTTDHTPSFSWTGVSGAVSYVIQLDTVLSFNSVNLIEVSVSSTNYTPQDPLDDGGWYWRVAGNDSDGHIGQFSEIRYLLLYRIDAPVLISPANDSLTSDATPTFEWNAVTGAVTYFIQLDTISTFASVNLTGVEIGTTSYTPSLPLNDGTWYWHVAGNDSEGNLGYFSETRILTIDTSPATWTILVYLDGDNDLEEFAFEELNSMELVGSTQDMKIIVLVDFYDGYYAPYSQARCYELAYDTNLDSIESIEIDAGLPSEPNMANWRTLRDFIVFGQAYAPAEHYLLIIWNHGGGCLGTCTDDTSDDTMQINRLSSALSSGSIQPFDIIAFDACFMGQLEVAYQIRQYCDYVVFSEEKTYVSGYPYETIFQDLSLSTDCTSETLVQIIIDRYIEAYQPGGMYYHSSITDVCLSAVKTALVNDIALALDDFAEAILEQDDFYFYYEALCNARVATQAFDWADFIDLGSFALQASEEITNSTIRAYAQTLYTAVQSAVFYEAHLSGVTGTTGIGITLNTYGTISLSLKADTHWDELMDIFVDFGETTNYFLTQVGTYVGYLNYPDDIFVFEFIPALSGIYRFDLVSLLSGYDEDFDLGLFDANMELLESSTSYGSTENFEYELFAGHLYYISVYSYPGEEVEVGVGVFSLTITQQTTSFGGLPPHLSTILIISGIIAAVLIAAGVMVLLYRRREPREEVEEIKPPTPIVRKEEVKPKVSKTKAEQGVSPSEIIFFIIGFGLMIIGLLVSFGAPYPIYFYGYMFTSAGMIPIVIGGYIRGQRLKKQKEREEKTERETIEQLRKRVQELEEKTNT